MFGILQCILFNLFILLFYRNTYIHNLSKSIRNTSIFINTKSRNAGKTERNFDIFLHIYNILSRIDVTDALLSRYQPSILQYFEDPWRHLLRETITAMQ